MRLTPIVWSLWCVSHHAAAAPYFFERQPMPTLDNRSLLKGFRKFLGGIAGVAFDDAVGGLLQQVESAVNAGDRDALLNAMQNLKPTASPTNVEDASSAIKAVATERPSSLFEFNSKLVANGIIFGTMPEILGNAKDSRTGENSNQNVIPESMLRAAIYIPKTFTFGQKPPVILLPGTGVTGYLSFVGNFIPLLTGTDWADPVWVNVPGDMLDDVQTNAEYAAYAMNYIASLTKRNVAVIGWSQGNLIAQWAFKYWPSTRKTTTDHVAVSANYNGSASSGFSSAIAATKKPSLLQQQAESKFIARLRSDGGDSAYVPTTSIYTGNYDQIVLPQSGRGASAYLLDSRRVGVSNTEVQSTCFGQTAGGFYTHEGVLANPLTFALAKDAITNHGPGQVSRIRAREVCNTYMAPGLSLKEFLKTENAMLIAGSAILFDELQAYEEPAIKHYATRDALSC
ncbi:hypothetical protein S40288_07527 [Stachybotrys chartarum IBT 40288]|nr:hypothetical protein S40288_07527 [Stachybotrys chartarum IBT 40288]